MGKDIKHAGGRPSKYDPNYIQVAQDYIDSCNREATQLPTIEGLALTIGVDHETILDWAKNNIEFSDAIKRLKEKQKDQLVNDGMYGGKEVNQAMAIFLLKANHGLIETSRTEIGGINGQPINIIAGRGFLPPNTEITSTPSGGDAKQLGTV